MKQFYRVYPKENSSALYELQKDLDFWREQLRAIFNTEGGRVSRVPSDILESLLACQDEDGFCRLVLDDETPPSDVRVDFWYWPTYFLTASLIHEQLCTKADGQTLSAELSKALKIGLMAAIKREFYGHGYDGEAVQLDVLNFYLDAGLRQFLEDHADDHSEFAAFIHTLLEQKRRSILSGAATDHLQSWLALQARVGDVQHLFTYGTLMTGNSANDNILRCKSCTFAGAAYLRGFRLYDLGLFPGILRDRDENPISSFYQKPGQAACGNNRGQALVFGELYRIGPEQLPELDAYEGEGRLYKRVVSLVQTLDGQREMAWTYEYLHSIDPAKEVPLGRQPWGAKPSNQLANKYVWYIAYGSNLLRERFLCYIRGGSFRGGRNQRGCSNKALPIVDLACRVPYPIYFGNSSGSWQNGGVTFLDISQDGQSQGRAYLITHDQFEDVHQQEGPGSEWYDQKVELGRLSEIPAVTFTNHGKRPENSPSAKYRNVVLEGINECQKLTTAILDPPGAPRLPGAELPSSAF